MRIKREHDSGDSNISNNLAHDQEACSLQPSESSGDNMEEFFGNHFDYYDLDIVSLESFEELQHSRIKLFYRNNYEH